jgi:hypothetical protein
MGTKRLRFVVMRGIGFADADAGGFTIDNPTADDWKARSSLQGRNRIEALKRRVAVKKAIGN